MNHRFVLRQLGLQMLLFSLALLLSAAWAALDYFNGNASELNAMRALSVTTVLSLVIGWALWQLGGHEDDHIGRPEALLLVTSSWVLGAFLAALPYWLFAKLEADGQGAFSRFSACYFEAMSGLTTTGASVLSDIEALPRGILLWRSLTQWLGGLGIVVLFVAVLPLLGVGSKRLFQAETPGPTKGGVRPRIRETARVLWLIYLGLTVAQTLLLRLAGMSWFDSFCHTLTTLATGGFSTRNASIAAYDSAAIDVIIIVFMILAATSFGLFYQLMRRRVRNVLHDPELRLYLSILLVASLFVTGTLVGQQLQAGQDIGAGSFVNLLRHSVFQVVSIQTTTGYATADFEHWPFITKFTLVLLMFIGGSAGSTGGGIKVIRILIVGKILLAELERVVRPNVVRSIRVGNSTVEPEMQRSVLVYVLNIIGLFLLGTVLLMAFEAAQGIDFTTAATASATTLNNIGPGLNAVGPTRNFGWFSSPSLLVMSLLMVLGRLEIYAILALLRPRFWSGE